MGPGEAISVLASIVLLIVVISLAYAAFERRLKHKERMAEFAANKAGTGEPARLAEMEGRLRVLERIATDRGHDIAHQIEALRDARRTEALLEARDAEVK